MRPEDLASLLSAARRVATAGLKTLLEQKHLYQSVELNYEADEAVSALLARQTPPVAFANTVVSPPLEAEWLFVAPREPARPPAISAPLVPDRVHILIPDIKTFCTPCGRVEPFNVHAVHPLDRRQTPSGLLVQSFALQYQCQSCKGAPEAFLIRRSNAKLQLCGRAPIEHVATPPFIPKDVRQYWSGAVVAFQSGQTLAGIFLLRTLIEQYLRGAATDKAAPVDRLLEAYLATLPLEFRDRFPSLSAIYERLSASIHAADASEGVYKEALLGLSRHFDARRVYDLPPPILKAV